MTSFSALILLLCLMLMAPATSAQTPPPTAPPVTCTLPNTSMISPNYCNAYDEQSMATQTQGCEGFLTNAEPSPSADCCAGLNNVASNRTACICKFTFFPPPAHNEERQLELPRLCGVMKNLCGQCPTFLVSRLNGTAPTTPAADSPPYSEGKSDASTAGAISIAVVFGVLLLVAIAVFSICLIKKRRKAKTPSPEAFEVPPPPGGAF